MKKKTCFFALICFMILFSINVCAQGDWIDKSMWGVQTSNCWEYGLTMHAVDGDESTCFKMPEPRVGDTFLIDLRNKYEISKLRFFTNGYDSIHNVKIFLSEDEITQTPEELLASGTEYCSYRGKTGMGETEVSDIKISVNNVKARYILLVVYANSTSWININEIYVEGTLTESQFIPRDFVSIITNPSIAWYPGSKALDGSTADESSLKMETVKRGARIDIDLGDYYNLSDINFVNESYDCIHHVNMYLSMEPIQDSAEELLASGTEYCSYEGTVGLGLGQPSDIWISVKNVDARYITFVVYEDTENWINIGEIYFCGSPWINPEENTEITQPKYYNNSSEITSGVVQTGTLSSEVIYTQNNKVFTEAAKIYMVVSEKESGRPVLIACDKYTNLDIGENTLQVSTEITEELDLTKYNLNTYVLKDNYKKITSFSQSVKADDVKFIKDIDSDCLAVSGNTNAKVKGESVTVILLDESENVVYIDECIVAEDGSFEITSIPSDVNADGIYTLIIDGIIKDFSEEIEFISPEKLKQMIMDTDAGQVVSDNAQYLRYDSAFFSSVEQTFFELLEQRKNSLSEASLKEWMGEALFDAIVSNDKLSVEYLEKWAELSEDKALKDELYSELEDKQIFISLLKENGRENIFECLDLAIIREADNDRIIEILQNKDMNLTRMNALSENNRNIVLHGIRNGNFTSFDDIQAYIDQKCSSFSNSKPQSGSSSGGGNRGSGSGVAAAGAFKANVIETVKKDTATEEEKIEKIVADNLIFKDMEASSWAKEAVYYLAAKGIVNGDGNGSFMPDRNVTRAEFAKMICLAANIKTDADGIECDYNDLGENHFAYSYIGALSTLDIMKGAEGSVMPDSSITRQDMIVIAYRVMDVLGLCDNIEIYATEFADEEDISDYAKDAVKVLYNMNIVNGVTQRTIAPKSFCTRAQAAKIIYEILSVINSSSAI